MAMTTSASEASALPLDVGNRVKSGGGGRSGDTSFMQALDSQMQAPRSEAPRPKHEPKHSAGAEKTKDSQAEKQAPERDPDEAAKTKTEKAPAARASRKEAKRAEAEEGQGAANVSETPTEHKSARAEAVTQAPAQGEGAAKESGNFLPLMAQGATATTTAASETTSETGSDTATAEGASLTLPLRSTMAGRADARVPGAPGAPESAELAALETDPASAKGSETVLQGGDADPGRDQGTATKNSDALLQAMRLGLGGQGVRAAEGADNFASALAELRDFLPARMADTSTAMPTTAATGLAAAPGTPAAGTTSAAANLSVAVPLGQQAWDQAMGERVVWMTRQGVQEAQIQLNPRDLGPVEVRVSVNQDQASVSFTAHNPAARDALEAALPKLREMLADSGLNLAQSDVSHQSPQQRQEGWAESGARSRGGMDLGGTSEGDVVSISETPLPNVSGVDFYA